MTIIVYIKKLGRGQKVTSGLQRKERGKYIYIYIYFYAFKGYKTQAQWLKKHR